MQSRTEGKFCEYHCFPAAWTDAAVATEDTAQWQDDWDDDDVEDDFCKHLRAELEKAKAT
jgi:hypothetical protein